MKITMIGCGAMGGSMAKKLREYSTLSLFDRNEGKMQAIESMGGAKAFSTLSEAVVGAEIIILAVKPKHLEEIAYELAPLIRGDQILVSVLGGVSLADLTERFGEIPLVRAMPNLPVELGKGVVGLTSTSLSEIEIQKVNEALEPLGSLHWAEESLLGGITAISGAGPAFISVIVESMIDAGVRMGLKADMARKLALETIEGTTALLKDPNSSPSDIKWRVASPGGITIKGIQEFEEQGIRGALIASFLAMEH